jgi:hypothetical protein
LNRSILGLTKTVAVEWFEQQAPGMFQFRSIMFTRSHFTGHRVISEDVFIEEISEDVQ